LKRGRLARLLFPFFKEIIMYVDNNLVVSGGVTVAGVVTFQTVTGVSAVLSTNTIDLGQNRDMGAGTDFLKMRMQVGTVFAGLTALTVEVIAADDAALTVNVTVIGSTGAVPVATLVANARLEAELNTRILSKGQRYLGVRYTPTGTGTTGTVFTDFGDGIEDFKAYPVGFSVT
jgi:hypothetical protein